MHSSIRKHLRPALALGALLVTASAVHAQAIALVNSATNFSTSAALAPSFTFSNFSLGAGNALVVVISSEAVSPNINTFSVSFGGQAVTANVVAQQAQQASAVYYFINPGITTGDVVVNFGTNSRAGVSVLSLSNVGGVGDSETFVAAANTPTFNLNYSAVSGGFVVAGYIDNASGVAVAPSISTGNINTTLLSRIANEGTSSAAIIQGYGSISSTATASELFTSARNNTNNNRHASALVAFTAAAVPEPSAFAALAGAAALGAVALRRRRV